VGERRVNYCCCSDSSVFLSIPKIYMFWLSKLPNVWRIVFMAASLSRKIAKKNSRLPASNFKDVVPGNTYGIAGQPLALLCS